MCSAEDNLSPIDKIVMVVVHYVTTVTLLYPSIDKIQAVHVCAGYVFVTVLLTKMFPVHHHVRYLNIQGKTNHHEVWYDMMIPFNGTVLIVTCYHACYYAIKILIFAVTP